MVENFQLFGQRCVRIAQQALDLLASRAPLAADETQQAVTVDGQRLARPRQIKLPGIAANFSFQPRL
ncbi:hypothetical protein D3C87_1373170 [compost metagenome]